MHDPIVYGIALIGADIVIWRFQRPESEIARLLIRIVLFAALTGVLVNGGLSPFDAVSQKFSPLEKTVGQAIEVSWWLIGARLLSLALDTLLLPRAWRRQRLFQDVFGAVVFLAALVAAFGFVLQLPIRGLVATSGALAIVLGLAIQSTLSDVFAGIVLNTTEPYRIGDWVTIDDLEGQVVETNWRATHLLDAQGNTVIVPNAVAAKTKIRNSSRPATVHGIRLVFEIDPQYAPSEVLRALKNACLACIQLSSTPSPLITVKQATSDSLIYETIAYVETASEMTKTSNELFNYCHMHLAAGGVPLRPLGYPQTSEVKDEKLCALRYSPIFGVVEEDELERIAGNLVKHSFKKNDILGNAGDIAQYLSVVQRGVLSVVRVADGKSRELRRLGPGETFGERSVLAELSEKESVIALSDGTVFRISKDDFLSFIRKEPDFAEFVCTEVHARENHTDGNVRVEDKLASGSSALEWLIDKVRRLHVIKF